MFNRLLILILSSIAAASPQIAHADELAWLEIREAYARAPLPGQSTLAVFMTLQNSDTQSHELVGARCDAAASASLHTHVRAAGLVAMRQVPAIELGAKRETELRPGGAHVMLSGLNRALKPGEHVAVTLLFEDHRSLTADVEIRPWER